jgi:hypothetical protein
LKVSGFLNDIPIYVESESEPALFRWLVQRDPVVRRFDGNFVREPAGRNTIIMMVTVNQRLLHLATGQQHACGSEMHRLLRSIIFFSREAADWLKMGMGSNRV